MTKSAFSLPSEELEGVTTDSKLSLISILGVPTAVGKHSGDF
jgi:hypothetical protein